MPSSQTLPQSTKPAMSAEAYGGLADDIWAQHVQLSRFFATCKDQEILEKIKAARETSREAGATADRKHAGRQAAIAGI